MTRKQKELPKPIMTLAQMRAAVKQLRSCKPAIPSALVIDLYVRKYNSWFRFTNIGVFKITVIQDEITFGELTRKSEIEVRKAAQKEIDEVKKSPSVLKLWTKS